MQKNRAFFLDRDGVIIRDIPYLNSVKKIEILPGVDAAIRRINKSGYKCIVVTNQSGVARGLVTLEQLATIHEYINNVLVQNGAKIDAFYYCPHHPDGKVKEYAIKCKCRKPGTELILRAANDFGIDLSTSVMVGDRDIDFEAGIKAGCKSFIIGKPMFHEGREAIFEGLNNVIDAISE